VKSKEFRVGLFAAGALVLLYFGFYYLKGTDFLSTRVKYYAIYSNVDQLAPSNPILINGVAVGRVNNIRIMQEKQNLVLVEMEIDSDVVLGDSTKAILNSELLGGKSILLNIGKITKPLEPGDTIKTEVPKDLLAVFTETAEPLGNSIQTSLRKLNTLIDNLSKTTQKLDTVFISLKETPGLVNKTLINANGKMDDLSGSLKNVADNLNGTLIELKPAIVNFKILSDSLKRLELNQTLTKTQQTISKLNETLSKLNKGDNTASKLLTEDSLYVNLNKLLQSLDSLSTHMNKYPNHFFAPLGKSHNKVMRDLKKEEEEQKKKKQETQKKTTP
jgi:phospholipid/cholesterol/gamma-HCH transport system substrate-binding protein